MTSAFDADRIRVELGSKVLERFAEAVGLTREDLASYRSDRAGWVADQSDRGLANWIHDRLWANLRRVLDDLDDEVRFVDREPVRGLYIGTKYRFRIKRHDEVGRVRTYPTQAALDFMIQDPPTLDGLDEVRLMVGYVWLREDRKIGATVMSLRDGQDNVLWQIELPEPAAGTSPAPLRPSGPVGPSLPVVDTKGDHDRSTRDQLP